MKNKSVTSLANKESILLCLYAKKWLYEMSYFNSFHSSLEDAYNNENYFPKNNP